MTVEIIGMVGTQDVSESRGDPGGRPVNVDHLTTLDLLTGGGRVAIHHITGGDEADQRRDGDFAGHDERYRRTAEFMDVLRRELTGNAPFSYDGEFYRVEGAFSHVKPAVPVPLYFPGPERG